MSGQKADPRVGATIGKYRVLGVLGRGGMGVVYEAEDPVLERRVALKLLSEQVSADREAVARFLAEGKAAARVLHPNVVAVFDVAEHAGSYFMAIELVRGESAGDMIKARGAADWREATRIIADAARGLDAAHKAGLVHRDIKPANIMRAADGTVKVADFGLAKALDAADKGLTQTGVIVGTPFYMSPEQCRGETLDARSDIYSLGAAYYALLTGKPPYTAGGSQQVMFAHCFNEIPDPAAANPAVPAVCTDIVRRAMAKTAAERYQTAAEMLADLEAAASEMPVIPGLGARPRSSSGSAGRPVAAPGLAWWPFAAAGATVLAIGAAFFLLGGPSNKPKPASGDSVAKAKENDPDDVPPVVPINPALPTPDTKPELKPPPKPELKPELKPDIPVRPPEPPVPAGRANPWDDLRAADIPAAALKAVTGGKPAPKELAAVLNDTADTTSLAFSRDGALLAIGGARGIVQIWSADGGLRKRIHYNGGNHKPVNGLAFAADGRTLMGGTADNYVKMWDILSENPRGNNRPMVTFPAALAIALSADGRTLAAATTKDVRHCRVEAGAFAPWQMMADGVGRSVGFTRDGRTLAVFRAEAVELWRITGGVPAGKPFDRIEAACRCGAISPDGDMLVIGGADGTLRIRHGLNGPSPTEAMLSHAHDGEVVSACFSPSGRLLATADAAGAIAVWETPTWNKRFDWSPAGGGKPGGVLAFAPDGRHLACTGPDGTVCLLRLAPAADR